MSAKLTAHQAFLAPLARLALKHADLEGQVITLEVGDWQAQDDDEDMLDAEEITFYAEGLMTEGFGMCWQVLAEADDPATPLFARLFFWQGITPEIPDPDAGWVVTATATHPAP